MVEVGKNKKFLFHSAIFNGYTFGLARVAHYGNVPFYPMQGYVRCIGKKKGT
jgi:hypothetical protein